METPILLYETKDKSIKVRIEFIIGNRLRVYHVGKTYPEITQCLIYSNGFLECFSTIIKHYKDEHNQIEAYKLSAKKAIKQYGFEWVEKDLNELVDKTFLTKQDKQ